MVDKSKVEHYIWGENCDGWHLVKTDAVSVIQERMPPGTSESRHKHSASRQFFFVLSGELEIESGGTSQTLRSHQGLEVPPGMSHQVLNRSQADAEFIVVSAPPSHGDRVVQE